MLDEIKPVPGKDGIFASRQGRVYRLQRDGRLTEIGAYQYVKWSVGSKGKKKQMTYVHRLVAAAFLPPVEGKPLVRHLDGNPRNNNVENLTWGDDEDNYQDAVKHGRSQARKTQNPPTS